MICSSFWFQKWLQWRWNHERCVWGFGVSQLHVFAVRSWLGFPQTHKTDGGRQRDYKQKLPHARSQGESVAQKIWNLHSNTCITLKHLAEGRRDPAEGRQSELCSRNAGSLSSEGGKRRNSKLQSCGLIKCRWGVYIAPSSQYAPAARFGYAQTGPATAPHASRTMDVSKVQRSTAESCWRQMLHYISSACALSSSWVRW